MKSQPLKDVQRCHRRGGCHQGRSPAQEFGGSGLAHVDLGDLTGNSWVTEFLEISLWLCQNSYWKWPFIVDFPIENGDFP